MRVLLVSTYELGHQPLHLASPAGVLRRAGHEVRCVDLSVESWSEELVQWSQAAAFSVPMHTAMRLAIAASQQLRERRPGIALCFYGLYAALGADPEVRKAADEFIAGEYEPALLAWVDRTDSSLKQQGSHTGVTALPRSSPGVTTGMARGGLGVPDREGMPGLERYARLLVGGEERLAGYVEASHGCSHRCRHCPVPVVYDGRTRLVGVDAVCADVERLVAMGAEHVTFGDPDFLNGRHHALRVVRAVHGSHPGLTFDFTAKVEHILRNRGIFAEMAASGCLFVVSAFESTNDEILSILDKGHTVKDAARAVAILREHGIEPRPSFVPFTPWTMMQDMVDLVDFVEGNDLVPNVDPVQYGIRLLVPPGSLLLSTPALAGRLGCFDAERLGYTWEAGDPALDDLQSRLAGIAARAASADEPIAVTFEEMRRVVLGAAGSRDPRQLARHPRGSEPQQLSWAQVQAAGRPRLSEAWFCCAEPMDGQLSASSSLCVGEPLAVPAGTPAPEAHG